MGRKWGVYTGSIIGMHIGVYIVNNTSRNRGVYIANNIRRNRDVYVARKRARDTLQGDHCREPSPRAHSWDSHHVSPSWGPPSGNSRWTAPREPPPVDPLGRILPTDPFIGYIPGAVCRGHFQWTPSNGPLQGTPSGNAKCGPHNGAHSDYPLMMTLSQRPLREYTPEDTSMVTIPGDLFQGTPPDYTLQGTPQRIPPWDLLEKTPFRGTPPERSIYGTPSMRHLYTEPLSEDPTRENSMGLPPRELIQGPHPGDNPGDTLQRNHPRDPFGGPRWNHSETLHWTAYLESPPSDLSKGPLAGTHSRGHTPMDPCRRPAPCEPLHGTPFSRPHDGDPSGNPLQCPLHGTPYTNPMHGNTFRGPLQGPPPGDPFLGTTQWNPWGTR
jgi:hypothetical protein